MVKLLHLAIVAVIIFVLTYNPKSGTLNKIIKPMNECCNDANCVAKHPSECKHARYENLQFDGPTGMGQPSTVQAYKGAILGS